MTLNQLIIEAENLSRQLTTGDIPLVYDDTPVDIQLLLEKDNDGYHCVVVPTFIMEKKFQRITSGEAKDALCGKPKPSELLKKHFEETPQEELDKEWENIKPLNDIGSDIEEYAKFFKTPEESLGITTEEYNKIVNACIWESGKEESDNKVEDYLERIAIDRVDKLIGKEVMSCVTLSDAEECYIQGYKDGRKSPITKFMEEHPMTEEGLNKARYRLAYEDGYRSCLKNVCNYLYENLPADYWGNITASPKNFINQLNEKMEEKL